VQAERQAPSITTRSPDFRSCKKKLKYDVATPPAFDEIRTSAKAGPMTTNDKATQHIKRRIEDPPVFQASALGHKRKCCHARVMTVLPLEADIRQREWHVRYVSGAVIR
jgi:hypothetical protein